MSRAIISRLILVCWRGLLHYCTLCCGVIYKYNLLDVKFMNLDPKLWKS
jgi:hypothetical protein